jgi:hypothetical protein
MDAMGRAHFINARDAPYSSPASRTTMLMCLIVQQLTQYLVITTSQTSTHVMAAKRILSENQHLTYMYIHVNL